MPVRNTALLVRATRITGGVLSLRVLPARCRGARRGVDDRAADLVPVYQWDSEPIRLLAAGDPAVLWPLWLADNLLEPELS